MNKIVILLISLFVIFTSCNRDTIQVSMESKQISSDIDIEDISFLNNDTMYICGGLRAQKGEIFQSCDAGKKWQKVYSGPDKLYCIFFSPFNNDAYAAGDCTHVQRSYNRGITWPEQADCSNFWINDKTSIRKLFFFNDKGGIAIGNQSREFGNVVFTWDKGNSWGDNQGKNGLNDWWIFNDDSIYASGYGILEKITHSKQGGYLGYRPSVTPLQMEGDYFTGIWFTSNKTGFMSGFNGGIYKTNDGGINWKEVYKKNSILKKRIHFNDVLFESETIGWVTGENGLLLKTENAGEKWQKVETNVTNNLKHLFYRNNTLYVSSENGIYFIIK